MLSFGGAVKELDRGDPPILIDSAGVSPRTVSVQPPAPAIALYSNAVPPARFRKDASFSITIMPAAAIGRACGDAAFIACSEIGGQHVIISNPCLFQGEEYARQLCHELGHVNGWPRMHGP